MQNFIKTIINGVQKWTKKEIKKSTADWNQNDENAADYVKNRTHWEEKKRTVLVCNLTFADYDSESHPKCNFVPGKKYDVIWNGKLYEGLVCWFDEAYNIIASSDNGCPFYIDDDGGNNLYIEANGDNNWVVSIIEDNTVVHKLDSKYIDLPDNLATTDDVQEAVDIANNKMNANNPVGTGSFSMNRKSGSNIGSHSHAEGSNTVASNYASHAEGHETIASGQRSHAEGYNTKAASANTHAEGYNTQATGINAHAEGEGTIASGDISHAEGHETTSSNSSSHAEGWKTIASGQRSHAEGYNTKATSYNTHAEGYNTQAINTNAHAEGNGTIASGQQAHAEGSGSGTQIKLTGDANSVTYTVDGGMSYIKVGGMLKYNETIVKIVNFDLSTKTVTTQNTLSASALNSQSVQLYSGIASGGSSHSEGSYTTASGDNSHAEGYYTIASGYDSHSEGSYTTASGDNSHAEGYYTIASGHDSHAEGAQTVANNALMHVFGKYNIYDNQKYTMAEGIEDLLFVDSTKYFANEYTFDSETGLFSLINPSQDYTNDDVEKLIGKYTLPGSATPDAAEPSLWKVVESTEYDGVYIGRVFFSTLLTQIEGKYAHIVGNGTSDTERSNAHTLDWNGVGWFQGGLQVGGNAQDDGARNVLLEGDAVPVPENASVGQTIAVKAVDENGKPVEWETTDISTSGGSGCVVSDTAPEDTSVLWIDTSDDSGDETPDVNLTGYATEQWVEDQNYLTEVPDGYAKTEDVPTDEKIIQLIKDNAPESSGGGIAVTGAKVGQTVKISAVDENGVPTAWLPTDFPSGGGEFGELELIVNHTVTAEEAEASSFKFTKEKYPLIDGQRFLLARITKPAGVSAWMKLRAGSTVIASWNSNTQLCFTTFQLALNGYWFGGVMDGSNSNGGATIPLASFVGTYKAYGEIGGTPYVYYDSLELYSYMAFLPEGTIIEIYGGR